MILHETVTLKNGIVMPKMALGTSFMSITKAKDAVKNALKTGFLHIDTAQSFNNEEGVAKGIKEAGIDRHNVFITTKIAAEIKNFTGAEYSIEKSLEKLDTDYIDLLLIHAPMPWDEIKGRKRYFKENIEVWKAMEKLYKSGRIRALGISNFKKEDIKNILENCTIEPSINQIKIYPGSSNAALLNYMKKSTQIIPQAYFPSEYEKILENPTIKNLSEKYGVSQQKICIKFALQIGTPPVIKVKEKEEIEEFKNMDFSINEEDMKILTGLGFKN
ncbi:MAG: aldo/keto reductase [Bacteroidales bacterium]|nr:aldo/keto reductase [Bacteroidales bacterium]